MKIFRSLLIAALLAILTNCSPYNYSKEVGDFDKSVTGLTTSVTSGQQALAQDAANSRRRDLIYSQRAVTFPPSCSPGTRRAGNDEPPCSVYSVGGTPSPAEPAPIPERLSDTLVALKGYTSGLAAVTKASDRAELDVEVGKLSKSIAGLISAVPGTGTVAAPVVSAAINVFGWLVGTAFDQQRFGTLKNAVNLVDRPAGPTDEKPMVVIAGLLDVSIAGIVAKRRNQLFADAAVVRAKIGPGIGEETYRTRLADLESILAKLEELRRSDPSAAAQGLATTHKALVDAVNHPRLDMEALVKALGDFKDKVATLQTALEAASTPATSNKKGE